ncbi:transposase [Anaerovibrio lipolyticus]|uniref:Transposase n=1 Tax=Anaerovibrio lipolyticus TaxID=82374 RepID=A0A0B2K0B5_9FIRM|nr:helix-turn-helix domain-containing protein [Anaerovibrio lipolyticus]KHM52403.1 transposase [Anaerovibrio lipolyticus]
MAKLKHSPEWMIDRVKEYLDEKDSCRGIARQNNIPHKDLRFWVLKYQIHGASAFYVKKGNTSYSVDFKIKCIKEVLAGKASIFETAAKYNISSVSVLRLWIKKYNANIELKDYNPKREVYMASARRKTTKDERLEIVQYCIEHENDYKNTAVKFDVSYNQIYTWVKKYNMRGEDALVDRRGHHKSDEEVDEAERLRRENLRLKQQLKEKDMTVELLKKVTEFERM